MAKIAKPSARNSIVLVVVIIVLIIAAGVSYYFFNQYQQTKKLLQNPTSAAQEQVNALVQKVGMIMDLPTGENPTVATISDITKLKSQPFFANAKNGFKVLLYQKAKKAILYDPFQNKIVEVQPLAIGNNATAAKTQPMKVDLYNGTTTVGLTNTTEQKLKSKFPDITVVSKTNASKNTYTKTIVIDLTGGKQKDNTTQLAAFLGGTVDVLPEGETKPTDADILVILGGK